MVVPPVFVADASFTLPWVITDEKRTPACEAAWDGLKSRTVRIHVPALWLWEISNVLVFCEKTGRIESDGIARFHRIIKHADIVLAHAGIDAVFSIVPKFMREHELTSYDAAYLALATSNNLPLATFDKALIKAAKAEEVPLVA